MADRITLFISRDTAERFGNRAISRTITDFRVTPATLKDDDTGHIDRGFKVTLLNTAGHPVGFL
ncbi:MAG: hypothetical protein E5X41_14880 [Mesorhizobium sp.]|nr:MAG: hypothetical protein E5X41_14880 [Mesorhizobium sp.]